MAALTTTINTIDPVGEHAVMTGSFTGEQDDSHLVLVPSTGYVFSCSISTPAEDAATPQVVLNTSTGGTSTNGSVRVSTTADSGTYTFTAHVLGAF